MRTDRVLWLALNRIVETDIKQMRSRGFQHIESRPVVCGSEHAFRLPTGYSAGDVVKFSDSLVAAVGAPVEVIDRGGAVVVRVVKKDFPERLKFRKEDLSGENLLIGYDRLFRPLHHRLMHLLSGGASGAGKTVWIRFILYQLIRMGADVRIVDLKGYSFFPFEVFSNVKVAKRLPEAADLLHEVAVELERREDHIIRTRNRELTNQFRPYVVVIDEAAQIAPKTYSGNMKQYAKFCDDLCALLSQKGRESRVILIYCTQKPTLDVVNGQVRANMETALAFRTYNHNESQVIIGEKGAERIPVTAPGRCIYRAERFSTLQVPFIGETDREWEKLLAPLKVEVLHHGGSQRAEPQRVYIDGSFSSAHRDDEATGISQRLTGVAKESFKPSSRTGGKQTRQLEMARSGKGVVSSQEVFTDEIPD